MLKPEVEHFSCSIGMSLFTIDRGNQSDNEGGAERGGGPWRCDIQCLPYGKRRSNPDDINQF
jgi:hypothetical protein